MALSECHRPPGEGQRGVETRLVVGRTQAADLGRSIRRGGIIGVSGGFEGPPAGDGELSVLAEPGLEGGDPFKRSCHQGRCRARTPGPEAR